jgi:hypothetical protein
MRRVLIATLIVLSFTTELLATNHDWGKAEKLKPGTPVIVGLWGGDVLSGRVDSANATGLIVAGESVSGKAFLQDVQPRGHPEDYPRAAPISARSGPMDSHQHSP